MVFFLELVSANKAGWRHRTELEKVFVYFVVSNYSSHRFFFFFILITVF
jgi:hypothetical protein